MRGYHFRLVTHTKQYEKAPFEQRIEGGEGLNGKLQGWGEISSKCEAPDAGAQLEDLLSA